MSTPSAALNSTTLPVPNGLTANVFALVSRRTILPATVGADEAAVAVGLGDAFVNGIAWAKAAVAARTIATVNQAWNLIPFSAPSARILPGIEAVIIGSRQDGDQSEDPLFKLYKTHVEGWLYKRTYSINSDGTGAEQDSQPDSELDPGAASGARQIHECDLMSAKVAFVARNFRVRFR